MVDLVTSEIEATDELEAERARGLVAYLTNSHMRDAEVEPRVEWTAYRRPELVLSVHTACGVYVAGTATHLVTPAPKDDRTAECAHCGDTFRPRVTPRTNVTFCSKPECQRARNTHNQRTRRAKRES